MRDALPRPGVLALERAIQLAIVATVVTAVLAAGALLSWLEPARKLRWAALLVLLALSLVAARRARPSFHPASTYGAAAGLGALALLSAAWSSRPLSTAAHAASFIVLLAACVALAQAVRGRPEAIRAVLDGVLAGTAVVALGGLLVLLFRHDRALAPATTSLPVRYQGLGGGPDTATMVMAVGVPLAARALADARRRVAGLLPAALLLLLLGSIVASGSRGALLAAFGGLLAYVLIGFRGARQRTVLAAGVAAVLVLSVLLTRVPKPLDTPPPAAQPVTTSPAAGLPKPRPGYVDANLVLRLNDDIGHPLPGVADTTPRPRTLFGTSGRAEAWQGALELGARRPLLGYGLGREDQVFVDRYVDFNSNQPENSYIGLFLQLGGVGVAVFLLLVGSLAVRVLRAPARLLERERRLVAACAGAFAAGLVLAFFQSYIYAVGSNAAAAVWICAFMLAAAATLRDTSARG
ncbi:MAG: O-antigen ligase family protein [Thermoleophilia bacterium]